MEIYPPNFPDQLAAYCGELGQAKSRDWHHDQRRGLFMNFLREGFGVEADEVELEHKLKAAQVKKGYIDALYYTTIFEFKSDLAREKETGEAELKRYLKSRPRPADFIAVLTDGLEFYIYQWEDDRPEPIDFFDLREVDALTAHLKIAQFLKAERPRRPTSRDVVITFGPHSAAFNRSAALMSELYDAVHEVPAVATKYREWNRLLAKVYGSELGYARLFVTHAYLVILSRLMVAQALYPKERRSPKSHRGIMTGDYFTNRNLPNLAEPDFFSWALDTEAEKDFVGLIGRLEKEVARYDFGSTDEDILKELYQGLVDPADRHDLGEYYTPEWLAELTLEKIGYQRGTLLDPSCGSGTFLMCAVRRLRGAGLVKGKLVEAVARDLAGIDVHPLAVLMAKANLLLALGADARGDRNPVRLPIFMADTLQTEMDEQKGYLAIPAGQGSVFYLPLASIDRPADELDRMIEEMQEFAHAVGRGTTDLEAAKRGFLKKFSWLDESANGEAFFWRQNVETAARLVTEKKNSIWAFILKNTYRPVYLRRRKVQYLVGNPPWLSYRYIKDAGYKDRVRELARELGLLAKGTGHLLTQLDLSTIFYRFCEEAFLVEGGKMAMVLPKSVVIGAKQHVPFQERGGFSLILDCEGVLKLFNVPCCVILKLERAARGVEIPCEALSGFVPVRNAPWSQANKTLHVVKRTHEFVRHEVRSPWYRERCLQGASLFPRAFWFVEQEPYSAVSPDAPFLQSSKEIVDESKDVWKRERVAISGQVEQKYLFYTVLAKGLLPFAIRRKEPIFLPIASDKSGRISLLEVNQLYAEGDRMAGKWLSLAEGLWADHRQATHRSVLEWIDYNQKLTTQSLYARHVVLFNCHGTNLTACRMNVSRKEALNKLIVNGFITDSVTYRIYTESDAHADYLCAILNSETVMEAIKTTMPRGLMGERHIHRRPFEVCLIPLFDPQNKVHQKIAALGAVCRAKAARVAPKMEGPVGRARQEMRAYLAEELREINQLVAELLRDSAGPKRKGPRKVGPADLLLF